jgi:hypothetical protein
MKPSPIWALSLWVFLHSKSTPFSEKPVTIQGIKENKVFEDNIKVDLRKGEFKVRSGKILVAGCCKEGK